jgi:hypothetical protein
MSYPNDAAAAAWYPDPQTPGQVRWWDGTNWTEHVSVPAQPVQSALHTVPQLHESKPAETTAVAAPASYGRHAAGPHPVPRQASNVPRIRPRERVELPVESLSYA